MDEWLGRFILLVIAFFIISMGNLAQSLPPRKPPDS